MNLLKPELYQAQALELFEAVSARISNALPHARIEHVGSSAVPGAISRGDLDVCVIVPAEAFGTSLAEIERLGYRIKEDTLRTTQLCMLVPCCSHQDHAIQLVEAGSRFEFFVTFRDALRTDPDVLRKYNEVKLASAGRGDDDYRKSKGEFIRGVLAAGHLQAIRGRLPEDCLNKNPA